MDSKLVAIRSRDGTARTWNLDTGKLVAGPFKCADPIGAIRFSHDSKKFAVDSWAARYLAVRYDVETRKFRMCGICPVGVRSAQTPHKKSAYWVCLNFASMSASMCAQPATPGRFCLPLS